MTPITSVGELLLRNARLAGGHRVDVLVCGGVISAMGADLGASFSGGEEVDAGGDLLLPGLIDGHLHLDKTLLGLPWMAHSAGSSLRDRIDTEKRARRNLPLSVEQRAANLLRRVVSRGTTYLRTHVDVDPEVGLRNLAGVLAARERFRDHVSVQVVAFPQSGVLAAPGTADLLDAAIAEGADLVGGLDPAGIDGDAACQLDVLFAIAERHGAGIDIHLHDPGEQGAGELRLIAERCRALGMAGRVTVSHAFCLGAVDGATFEATAEALAAAGVSILTHGPGSDPMPPIKRLRAAGVTLAAGSDNIRDAWSPYGSGDMLERVMWIAYRSGFRTDEDLALAFALTSTDAARALGLESYGLAVGSPADFVTVPAETLAEAIVGHGPRSLVVKSGRIVARGGEPIGVPG